MDKQTIVSAFYNAISNNAEITRAIFGNSAIPNQNEYNLIESTLLTLSSVNFVDLLIEVEEQLEIEFAEDFLTMSKITIGDLAEKIKAYV